jgi:hypothetical protein
VSERAAVIISHPSANRRRTNRFPDEFRHPVFSFTEKIF